MVNTFSKYAASIRAGALTLVEKVADRIIIDTIDSFKARKTGRLYSTLPNRSSAPGETPAFQTGNLAQSITKTSRLTQFGAEAEIKVTADYAKYLVSNNRPILSPAGRKHRATLRNGVLAIAGGVGGNF